MIDQENRQERKLPNRFVRYWMSAIEDESGQYTLRMVLRDAKLEQYVEQLPPDDLDQVITASEFSALIESIRVYFGRGARGSLNRIGRSAWRQIIRSATIFQRMLFFVTRLLPPLQYCQRVLSFLAAKMGEPDGEVSVHLLDKDLIFMDTSSDSTIAQNAEGPICWATLGMIQAALFWATDEEQNVEEISCRATGAAACRFRVRLSR